MITDFFALLFMTVGLMIPVIAVVLGLIALYYHFRTPKKEVYYLDMPDGETN